MLSMITMRKRPKLYVIIPVLMFLGIGDLRKLISYQTKCAMSEISPYMDFIIREGSIVEELCTLNAEGYASGRPAKNAK